MGLRSDIQTDLSEAMLGDLLDAVSVFNFSVLNQANYDSNSDSYASTEELSPCKGIFSIYDLRKVDGFNVRVNDEEVIVNGDDVLITPVIGMKIKMGILGDGDVYTIIKTNPILGGESTPIIYNMQVRNDAFAQV